MSKTKAKVPCLCSVCKGKLVTYFVSQWHLGKFFSSGSIKKQHVNGSTTRHESQEGNKFISGMPHITYQQHV